MGHVRSWRWLVVPAAFAVLAGACDSGGGGLPGAEKNGGDSAIPDLGGDDDAEVDGCEIVTAEDAEDILLEPVTKDLDAIAIPLSKASCTWEVDREGGFKLLQFSLWEGSQFYGKQVFEGEESFEPIEGVGDDAFFVDSFGGTSFQALDGSTMISLDVSGFDVSTAGVDSTIEVEAAKERVLALAKRVLSEV